MLLLCHECHEFTELHWAAWPQLDNYNILISEQPGLSPPRKLAPGRSRERIIPGRCPPYRGSRHPGAPGPGLGHPDRPRITPGDLIQRVAGARYKVYIKSRPGQSEPGIIWGLLPAWTPGIQCGDRIWECLINFIETVSAHCTLGPSINYDTKPPTPLYW